jgi:hypothetical protein
MPPLATLLCLFCWSASAPAPDMAREAGNIWYRHEVLSHGKHLLRLSTTDLILDTGKWRKARLIAFAENFAASTCGGRYTILNSDRLTTYAAQVLFRCP